ncbi:MAG TPA: hypothetical protein PLN54_10130 [Flavobacteriales bacterium]|nr:hypothetical protein [Flavobacteriales bacterium]
MVSSPPYRIDVALATVVRTGPDRIDVRCHDGVKWTNAGIAEVMSARRAVAGGAPQRVLVVMPAELDFELSTMTTAHYDPADLATHCRAEAWAVLSTFNARLFEVYFSYFTSPVPCAFFITESEALAWLEEQ